MYKEFLLKSISRRLWTDHVIYTRQFIISSIDNIQSPDIPFVVQRLMINQEEIGNLFKPYYGEEKSSQITYILKEHIDIFAKLVTANIKKDLEHSVSQKTYWYMNAIKIANFLSQINPKYNKIIIRDHLFDHLDFTERELLARLRKDYVLDIIMFDSVYDQILQLADVLSEGLINQFKIEFKDDYKNRENTLTSIEEDLKIEQRFDSTQRLDSTLEKKNMEEDN